MLGFLFKFVLENIYFFGKVLYYDIVYNFLCNEYFVIFDLDVNNDVLLDYLYVLWFDILGEIVDRWFFNYIVNIENYVGIWKF